MAVAVASFTNLFYAAGISLQMCIMYMVAKKELLTDSAKPPGIGDTQNRSHSILHLVEYTKTGEWVFSI